MSSRVVVVSGPPGAGKTTVARRIAQRNTRAVHLHSDDFWHFIVSGALPPHTPESDEQNQTVLRAVSSTAFTYASGGFLTVVDGIVGPWMLHHFQTAMASAPAVTADYIVLRPAREVALARAVARGGERDLTDPAVIGTMWDQLADLGEWEQHAVDTGADTIPETVDRVMSMLDSGECRLPSTSQ